MKKPRAPNFIYSAHIFNMGTQNNYVVAMYKRVAIYFHDGAMNQSHERLTATSTVSSSSSCSSSTSII